MNKRLIAGVLSLACVVSAVIVPAVVAEPSITSVKASNNDIKEYGRLSYTENSDGTLTIVGCAQDVVWVDFDGVIDGKYITAIADNAFANCGDLKYVHLSDTITSIGEGAFSCTGLESVTLPPYLKTLGVSAFDGCSNLSEVYIFNYRRNMPTIENHVFDDCAEDVEFFCPMGSAYSLYCLNRNLPLKQSNYYWVDTPMPDHSQAATDEKPVQEGTTEESDKSGEGDDSEDHSTESDKKQYNEVDTSSGSGSYSSSGGSASAAPVNAEKTDATRTNEQDGQSERPVSPAVGVVDTNSDTSLKPGEVSGGVGEDPPRNFATLSLEDKYGSFSDNVSATYKDGEVVHSDVYGDKIIKGPANPKASYPYEWVYTGEGYVFSPSGLVITKQDYVTLCNCVALEYGAEWVPEWEMALVCEVIYNRYKTGQYASIHDVIAQKGAFEHSEWYTGLDHFSGRVNDRVVNAVNLYLSYPGYFKEGYTCFRGDGTWNYFW